MATGLQISLSAEVRRELSAADVADVLGGRVVPAVFRCAACGRPGDARREPAHAVLWIGARAAGQPATLLALVHAPCAGSQVRHASHGARCTEHDAATGGGVHRPGASARARDPGAAAAGRARPPTARGGGAGVR